MFDVGEIAQLLDAVWGHQRAVTDRTVDVYILRLRQKIEADPANGAVFGAGCASNALDVNRAVQSATAAALSRG